MGVHTHQQACKLTATTQIINFKQAHDDVCRCRWQTGSVTQSHHLAQLCMQQLCLLQAVLCAQSTGTRQAYTAYVPSTRSKCSHTWL